MVMKHHPHPGEMLKELVFTPLSLEVTEAASRLGVSRTTLSRVLNGRAGISADLAVRLEMAGCSTARFWFNLQLNYEISRVKLAGLIVRPLHDDAKKLSLPVHSAD